ncbi:pyridoxamine 5'-phosphate oxidase family protein [Tetragenococcus muriaticus]|uniref:Pyridoxamine 5'-phosphate oxidase n=2 Tax=Tetragenococcus muriaticus TaxID=64642 RepID=A0A091BYQ6_9ENTE|nr:pyridoxamine 5'-phosphate oxidase family protein [Tetragenococcus muriaticus]KFN89620.1 pyridoxamine 5'-phosphate oxidase [Tetragenococcus muriaticus 3MR10-3]KFN89893.1 pyridoxamine 5'-phosphate oxidase [Tetragenococcus muriaticus PMC-11-5]GMA47939.1 hypothetical protein GCM10025854_21890 [Tetragenococcus muriaticus]
MKTQDIMKILEKDMKVAIFATVDENNHPHARPINIGVANEEGVFFMTSPKTNFYQQMQSNSKIAITGFLEEEYLIQVIRIEGKVRKLGKEKLQEVLQDNSYIDQVYPDKQEQQSVQVFQLYEGEGFYHSLTQGHKYTFSING